MNLTYYALHTVPNPVTAAEFIIVGWPEGLQGPPSRFRLALVDLRSRGLQLRPRISFNGEGLVALDAFRDIGGLGLMKHPVASPSQIEKTLQELSLDREPGP